MSRNDKDVGYVAVHDLKADIKALAKRYLELSRTYAQQGNIVAAEGVRHAALALDYCADDITQSGGEALEFAEGRAIKRGDV